MAECAALRLKVGPCLSWREDIRLMIDLGVFSAAVSRPCWGER
jgi:hypothetical protein